MKQDVLKLFMVLTLMIAVVGCKKKADEATTTDAVEASEAQVMSTKYMTNPAESVINWKGFKPTGTHNGTIKIDSGVLTVTDGEVESGSFIIDMNSIVNLDIPADKEGNGKLVGHLKSADFFDVEKFPNAAFEVTGFEEKDGQTMLSGNLMLKEKKNNITFPVSVSENGDEMTLTSETFTIDRSKWDVKYGSKSFFDDLGDKFINDDIELMISVKAKKS
ncbi:MAG: YceI family protein [Flavobacteriaceae bacterium]|nr:YceI family protein [Bacteroidia bacterium]MBT8286446.1 YceI family protein [Bacteroidia bacterium]NNF75722.1 YceI family protein [Flavobacteriaceae bacterium]NNK74269.1 YceI family protein [Flavobacteriaceae bacterium]